MSNFLVVGRERNYSDMKVIRFSFMDHGSRVLNATCAAMDGGQSHHLWVDMLQSWTRDRWGDGSVQLL